MMPTLRATSAQREHAPPATAVPVGATPVFAVNWLVTDMLPFPPRNGLTLPLFHYATALANSGPLQLVLLWDEANPLPAQALADNEARFGRIRVVPMARRGLARRAFDELRQVEMMNHGWRLVADGLALQALPPCDALLVSPMSAVAKARSSGLISFVRARFKVAATHDCKTAEYHFRGQQQIGLRQKAAKTWMDRQRCKLVAPVERQLLADYDCVTLQTDIDRQLMASLVSTAVAAKVELLPNGVAGQYFALVRQPSPRVVFVAELSGEYADIARWLVTEVWPQVLPQQPDIELLMVGGGASDELHRIMAATPRVRHLAYVEELSTVYAQAAVALSPVFKGFGLINKTLEAMASGLPVVGGLAAFNGIAGFGAGVHGIVCEQRATSAFVESLSRLLKDEALRDSVGQAARRLLQGQFQWETSLRRLVGLMREGNHV
jgi:glycosyltransferase involved in cell wall biosynthesis